jgi:hypothetical protein
MTSTPTHKGQTVTSQVAIETKLLTALVESVDRLEEAVDKLTRAVESFECKALPDSSPKIEVNQDNTRTHQRQMNLYGVIGLWFAFIGIFLLVVAISSWWWQKEIITNGPTKPKVNQAEVNLDGAVE